MAVPNILPFLYRLRPNAILDSITYFKLQFDYNLWANEQVAESLVRLESDISESERAILGHILGAEQLWLDRLQAESSGQKVWPDIDLDEFVASAKSLHASYDAFLTELSIEGLTRPIAYTNSEGIPWANRVEEILIHVLLHGAYHRGQLALSIRQSGGQPVLTDFIHAVRTGLIEGTV